MANETIKVGFIGAGANTALRHIPGLRAQQGVELAGVANRSIESSQTAADKYELGEAYPTWLDLVEDPEIDAVCIGTWPYMHSTITLTALDNGKHVMCEARMAMNGAEAKDMLAASIANPDLITQVVPPPHLMACEQHVIDLIADGYVGDIVNVNARVTDGSAFPDSDQDAHWRHIRELSGNNVMTTGIWYENLMRLVGPAESVSANAQIRVPHRRGWDGNRYEMTIPDQIDVIYSTGNGANVNLSVTTVSGPFAPPTEIWIYGTEGTIHIATSGLSNDPVVSGARKGDSDLSVIDVPAEKRGSWRVEEEFINAIRGTEPITRSNFTDSLKYMVFTDAIQESWQTGKRVYLAGK
ncbi:MAG: Gfo/Idh/MocA family oxidoreductase [Chloroflexi bacterium]|jgi:predicted dehydrogenase|nr:Gfo/Idh/MocA family oxidoreductase [Chloroflexota bacterium]MBT5627373.1 Gfo/Idh/MocA family oxidoreductase [Chloroflexota bacterium]